MPAGDRAQNRDEQAKLRGKPFGAIMRVNMDPRLLLPLLGLAVVAFLANLHSHRRSIGLS
ncbi:hypothetical protein [Reyranella sp.]|uniref:hypothetical protein n=1 Tax=Reyranella sp. TaxID=1929291 RepID=UPI00378335B6